MTTDELMDDVPVGLCQCGCGQRTARWPQSYKSRGIVKGTPKRFISGHNTRLQQPAPAPPRGEGHDYLVDSDTGCWIWQRYRNKTGYGRCRRDGRLILAHRWYYEQRHGPIPQGQELDHLCRVSACVNPDHLEPVTTRENCRRGKQAKLTHEQAIEIYRSDERHRILAARYGISTSTIEYIKAGKRWGDVTGARPG